MGDLNSSSDTPDDTQNSPQVFIYSFCTIFFKLRVKRRDQFGGLAELFLGEFYCIKYYT